MKSCIITQSNYIPWKGYFDSINQVDIFVIYDDRSNSSSNGSFYETRLSPENYFRLTVPPGVWVAFKGMKDNNMLLNIIPDEHDPFESDNLPLDGINYSW